MTQLRVAALIDSYRSAFEKGDLVAFMGHFGPEPRENTNRGRAWFEKNYEDLFAQSGQRKFALDIASITPTGDGDWKVSAAFDLRVDYRGRPAVHASGSVNYRVQQQPEGWRIDSIEYGN
jgi:ketosteroid isomerase-like protein